MRKHGLLGATTHPERVRRRPPRRGWTIRRGTGIRASFHDAGAHRPQLPRGHRTDDIEGIEDSTHRRAIVKKFRLVRREVPTGTRTPMRDVGRPDVYSLHGPDGDRACTWYDDEAGVCWFLGWVAQHDYTEFETRAANHELLPDEDDYTILEVERENLDFDQRIGPGIQAMVAEAFASPNSAIKGTVGDLLVLHVTVEIVLVDDEVLADLYITVGVPPLEDPPEGWPGRELPVRLAELATGLPADDLVLGFPAEVPGSHGPPRPIDFGSQLAVVVQGWEPSTPD